MLLDTKFFSGQLYWRCAIEKPVPCYDIYIAPSFCWTSVSSVLTADSSVWGDLSATADSPESARLGPPIESHLGRIMCKVLDAETTPLSSIDPLGPVTAGFLTLRAPLIPCLLNSADGEDVAVKSTPDLGFETSPFYCRFDSIVSRIELPNGRATVARSQHKQPFYESEASIILLRTVTDEKTTGSPTVGVEGIILGRCPDRNGFQRLGYIQIRPPGDISAIDWTGWETEITIY